MKYFIIVLILLFSNEKTHGQTWGTPGSRGMIDNIKTVKPKPLVRFTLPPQYLYKAEKGKVYDTTDSKHLAPAKKYGTFFFDGKPLKATRLLLNLNGNFSSLPIEGILIPRSKPSQKRLDTLPKFPHAYKKIENIRITKPQAKFLYNTDKGQVYALPQDNMPCLVPNSNSNMPVAKLNIENFKKIPNAYPKHNLIPNRITINPPGYANK